MDIVAESLSAGVLKTKNVTVNGQRIIDWFESKLSAAVSFVGVFNDINDAPKKNGAVAIVGSKDYIYSEAAGKWQEFGDEGQIGAISQAVDAISCGLSDYVLSSDLSSDLSSKQDKLSDPQISAIDSVVDERATFVKYQGGVISSFNIVGEIYSISIPNRPNIVEVKIGNTVTSIGDYGLYGSGFTSITIPDSVTSIKEGAF
jgi:hypothetical protein